MLNNEQITFLAKLANLDIYTYDELIIGVNNRKHSSVIIKHSYDDFRAKMGKEDIRLHWLLSDKCFLAGGSVLNWVWGEDKNEDIDFFFTNEDSSQNFRALINNYGFEETQSTHYALTCFNQEEGLIIQVVGSSSAKSANKKRAEFNGFIPFGTPEETIGRFDISVCKFSVDCDYIYFTVGAIHDLISMNINASESRRNTKQRILKYNRKGFYLPEEEQSEDVSGGSWY